MKKIFTLLAIAMMAIGANAQVEFSWESEAVATGTAAPEAKISGGTITTGDSNAARVNYKNTVGETDYYTICLNGKSADIDSDNFIQINTSNPFAGTEKIYITGYYNKGEEKSCSVYFKYENGEIVADTQEYSDIQNGTENIKTYEYAVPAAAVGSNYVKLTRNAAGTNIFITKLIITNSNAIDNITVDNTAAKSARKVVKNGRLQIETANGTYSVVGQRM